MSSNNPLIIQGGMGAGVSDWRLAQAVSRLGQLGVVSGVALDEILIRRLQDGDPGGAMRHGLDHLPFPRMAERIRSKYFIAGGKGKRDAYRSLPAHTFPDSRERMELCIAANFVEVFLAREGHRNPVGINYLEKIQIPHLPSMYGAMLAGVNYVLMGAGIPLKVPGVLDSFVHHQPASYPLQVTGAHPDDDTLMHFDPSDYFEDERLQQPLRRPKFLPIVSSNTLALTMLKRANGSVQGFILEGATAGGHNAPPRGKLQLNESGEPIYGERDAVDLAKIRELGVPFWLAGGFGSAGKLQAALDAGAAGVQVGTAFACCEESGLHSDYKQHLVRQASMGLTRVFTDPMASPTGFPFKVAQIEGTASDPKAYSARPRICDIGFLREPYRMADGSIGYRCSGEPVSCYVSKGGKMEDSVGRKCICNALVANIGLPQVRSGHRVELAIVTMGDDLKTVAQFLRPGESSYTAQDVVEGLLGSPYDRLAAMPAVNVSEACEAVC
jgi:nitronate monooxygenase